MSQSPGTSGGNTAGNSTGTTTAGLTATGCTGGSSELAGGTLTSVNGTGLVLTSTSGSTLTVTTSAATKITREVAGSLADITDGAHVIVRGTASGTGIVAASIGISPGAVPSPPSLPTGSLGKVLLRGGLASGTATGAGTGGFTVVEQDGTRVQVTTSSSTTVLTLVAATLSQLRTGEFTAVVGTSGSGGRLAAATVEQESVSVRSLRPVSVPTPRALPGSLPRGLPRALPSGLPRALPSAACPQPSPAGAVQAPYSAGWAAAPPG